MSNALAEPIAPEHPQDVERMPEIETIVQPKVASQKRRRRAKGEGREFKKKIRDLKSAQRKRIQAMARKHRASEKFMQKRLKGQLIKSRKDWERDLVRAKRNYRSQLEHIREFYGSQNLAVQNELKTFFAAQLEEVKKGCSEIAAANSQSQLEALERWLKDEFLREMREKATQINKAELEQARLSGQLQVGKLIQQLEERNLEVELLKQKVQQMERQVPQVPQEHGEATNFQEVFGEQDESQKQELLSVIKEIAEEQQAMQGAGEDAESKQPFWGRFRTGMKQKLFSEPSEA